jgi:hypothetical protein
MKRLATEPLTRMPLVSLGSAGMIDRLMLDVPELIKI